LHYSAYELCSPRVPSIAEVRLGKQILNFFFRSLSDTPYAGAIRSRRAFSAFAELFFRD